MTAKMSLFWMSIVPAGAAVFLLYLAVMGLISDAPTSLKAIMAISAVLAGCIIAIPFTFLIFGRKKGAAEPVAAQAAPAAAAAPAASAADVEEVDMVEEASGEVEVFEEESNEFDLGEDFDDDRKK